MKTHELREKLASRRRQSKRDARIEGAIINHLPSDLDVARVYVGYNHTRKRANAQGGVEIKCRTYEQALALRQRPQLKPSEVRRVVMQRDGTVSRPTISFYPAGLIPATWPNEHEVMDIHDTLFQMQFPPGGPSQGVVVFLEWFIEVRKDIFANVRAYIEKHGCRYSRIEGRWMAQGFPPGEERILRMAEERAPYVTVYWWAESFSTDWTLDDHLARTMGEVAHA